MANLQVYSRKLEIYVGWYTTVRTPVALTGFSHPDHLFVFSDTYGHCGLAISPPD